MPETEEFIYELKEIDKIIYKQIGSKITRFNKKHLFPDEPKTKMGLFEFAWAWIVVIGFVIGFILLILFSGIFGNNIFPY